jgi:hypothetical protein
MLEKRWPFISFLLLTAMLSLFWFWPWAGTALVPILVLFSLGATIFFIVRRQARAYRAGQMDRRRLVRVLFIEITGVMSSIVLAAYLGKLLFGYVDLHLTGWVGRAIGITLVFTAGVLTGLLIQRTWGRLAR